MKKSNLVFLILIILLISLYSFNHIFLPKTKGAATEVLFWVKEGENLFDVSKNLKNQDLIKSDFYFQVFTILSGKHRELKAGIYQLSPNLSIYQILRKIAAGESAKVKITIPEGQTLKQIQQKFYQSLPQKFQSAFLQPSCQSSTKLCDRTKMLNLDFLGSQLSDFKVSDFKKDFQFLESAPDYLSLEGFLFPDTYFFKIEDIFYHQDKIAKTMLENFDKKLTQDLRSEIKKQKRTIFEIIVMASLLEKEVKTLEDKKLVSGILWKRLNHQIPLQVDATITFITGKKTIKITKEETQIDHPYNTYRYLGLPPGPICNPGMESIRAAIYPKESDFLYYLSTLEGETIFSKTLDQHNQAKAKYLK